jgi:hypothetical protein
VCKDHYRSNLDDLIALAPDLEAALSNSMSTVGEKVSGSPSRMLELNDEAARVRWQIHHDMTTTVRLVIEERDWHQYPRQEIEPMARWLRNQVEWLSAHASAGERANEASAWPGMARGAIHPNPSKRVKIGPCVKPDCPGILTAVVRPQDSLLPSSIVCSWWTDPIQVAERTESEDVAQEPHVWSADQWHALGRQMARAVL